MNAADIVDFVRAKSIENPKAFDLVLVGLLTQYAIETERAEKGEHCAHVRRYVYWHIMQRFGHLMRPQCTKLH